MPIVLNGTTGINNDATNLNYTGTLTGGTGVVNLGSGQFYKDASGNVGIGTSSPSVKFHVSGQSRVADSSNAANYMTFGVGANASYGNASISTTTAGLSIVAEGAGNMVFLNNGSERMRIDSSGNLLVGTTSSAGSFRVQVVNTSSSGNAMWLQNASGNDRGILVMRHDTATGGTTGNMVTFQNASGSGVGAITSSNTATTYATSSDYRLKHDIQPMIGALAKVAALKPVTYKWNADDSNGEGFIAHELQEVCPSAVTGEKDAVDAEGKPVYQGIDTSFVVPLLTAALQEAVAKIESLTARIEALEGQA
jgi:hypothetical protein